MRNSVRKGFLWSPQDILRYYVHIIECFSNQKLLASLFTSNSLVWWNGEVVRGEKVIQKRDAQLEPVRGCRAISAANVIQIQIVAQAQAFVVAGHFSRRLVEVDVALANLVAALARKYDDRVCVFTDVFAQKVHADRGSYRRYVVRLQGFDDVFDCVECVLSAEYDFVVLGAQVFRYLN